MGCRGSEVQIFSLRPIHNCLSRAQLGAPRLLPGAGQISRVPGVLYARKECPMSVASQQVPAYQRHEASGQAVVKLGGRVVYLGPFGSDESRVRYRREVAEWQALGSASRSCSSGT